MEAKKFISTLKGFKTRFTKTPNAEVEKKSVETLVEKFGGKLEATAALKEAGENELNGYLKNVLGIIKVVPAETPSSAATTKPVGKVISKDDNGKEYAEVNGKVYVIDTVNKTMKKVYKDFKDLASADLDVITDDFMPMTVYQRYLRDRFHGEDMPIKKGKLHFRGYRISCTAKDGFIVEDSLKHYAAVETPFEGIPSPKELGDWLDKPRHKEVLSAEEYKKAVERGKELSRKNEVPKVEDEEPDFEALRKKVFMTIADARSKTIDVDPEKFVDMIPFKRWKRKVKSLFTQWKDRKIRYAKFLNGIEEVTKEETFVIEEKRHRNKFVGTLLPKFTWVGDLDGNMIEVDGKWIAAVPFLTEYLLHFEKRAMPQLMKFANGDITAMELISNPLEVDWKVEYRKGALENTAENAQILGMLYESVGFAAPQDRLYKADLEVGDRIKIFLDGELVTRTISDTERGIRIGKGASLLKIDKWVKLPKKEK